VNSAVKGTLIWEGSIRALESVQANTAGRTGQVKSPFLIGTGLDVLPAGTYKVNLNIQGLNNF